MKIFTTRHLLPIAAGVLCSMLTGGAQADATLAQNKGCLTCHHSERKVIGPAFKDVATRYQNDKDAAAMLATKIKDGVTGAGLFYALVWRLQRHHAHPKHQFITDLEIVFPHEGQLAIAANAKHA